MQYRRFAAIAAVTVSVLGGILAETAASANAASSCGGSRIESIPFSKGKASGRVDLYWNGSSKKNCAIAYRTGASKGVKGATSVKIDPDSGKTVQDSGSYSQYAGPVTTTSPGCITLSASVKHGSDTATFSKHDWCGSGGGSSTGGGQAKGGMSAITGAWRNVASCESSLNPRAVDPTGTYYGLFQFDLGTWHSVGGSGSPINASPAEQLKRAKILYSRRGAAPWPKCGRYL